MQRQINHRYCKKFKKPSLKNPLILKKKEDVDARKKSQLLIRIKTTAKLID
jgi:hypothetical protein